jgi:hypothetical protein
MCESRSSSVSVSFDTRLALFFFAIVGSYHFREPRNVMPSFSTVQACAHSGVVSLYAAFSTGSRPPSTPACLRDSAPRWCSPSPPIHGRRMRWRVNACSYSSDDLSISVGQQLWSKFFDLFGWDVQSSGYVRLSVAFRCKRLDDHE